MRSVHKPIQSIVLLNLWIGIMILGTEPAAYGWPIQGNPSVCGSFGTYEYIPDPKKPGDYTTWHPGLDIPGASGSEVRAVHTGTVVGVEQEGRGPDLYDSITIYVRPDDHPCQLDVYAHCDALPNSPIYLFMGTYGSGFQPICDRSLNEKNFDPLKCRITQGQAFARIADPTAARTTFPHIEYRVVDTGYQGPWEPQTCPRRPRYLALHNPFDELGVQDPYDVRPAFGPLYVRQYQSPTVKPYQSSAQHPYLFGKVQLLQEITDDMDDGSGLCPRDPRLPDPDAWGGASTAQDLFRGIISSPHRVAFSITNAQGQITYPTTEVRFAPPLWANSATGNFVYEPLKAAYDFQGGSLKGQPQYTYCYNLTNLLAGGQYPTQERYWNTRLHIDQPWNGDDALINKSTQYPDGEYTLVIEAEDLASPADPPHKEPVIVDNFLPYVERVTVNSGDNTIYSAGWELGALDGQLALDWLYYMMPREFTPGETLHVRIRTSETMQWLSVALPGSPSPTDLVAAPDSEGMIWEGELEPPESDNYTLTIRGQDLAENHLLAFSSTFSQPLPRRDVVSGAWPSTSAVPRGADTVHRLEAAEQSLLPPWHLTTTTDSTCEEHSEDRVACAFDDESGSVTLTPTGVDPDMPNVSAVSLKADDVPGTAHSGAYWSPEHPEDLNYGIVVTVDWNPDIERAAESCEDLTPPDDLEWTLTSTTGRHACQVRFELEGHAPIVATLDLLPGMSCTVVPESESVLLNTWTPIGNAVDLRENSSPPLVGGVRGGGAEQVDPLGHSDILSPPPNLNTGDLRENRPHSLGFLIHRIWPRICADTRGLSGCFLNQVCFLSACIRGYPRQQVRSPLTHLCPN